MEGISTCSMSTNDQEGICIEPESFESQLRSPIGYPLHVQPALGSRGILLEVVKPGGGHRMVRSRLRTSHHWIDDQKSRS